MGFTVSCFLLHIIVKKPQKVCNGCLEHIHIRCKVCPNCKTACPVGRIRFQVGSDDPPPKATSEMFHRMCHKVCTCFDMER